MPQVSRTQFKTKGDPEFYLTIHVNSAGEFRADLPRYVQEATGQQKVVAASIPELRKRVTEKIEQADAQSTTVRRVILWRTGERRWGLDRGLTLRFSAGVFDRRDTTIGQRQLVKYIPVESKENFGPDVTPGLSDEITNGEYGEVDYSPEAYAWILRTTASLRAVGGFLEEIKTAEGLNKAVAEQREI
jgi:hypothetical protein